MLAASAAVAIQCHPVLFLGRSFVSPDNAGFLLYDHFPTLPGYQSTGLEDGKGSDVGAILYSCMHYPGLEWDAVFKDHELPLWNRYVQGGVPLLGQGQSMFGGILNMIPMLGGSSALSWDIHFLLSRWLYAFGIGLAVWRLTRHLPAAALTSLTCVFVGFFAYRLNHMAQFSVDLAPWIVVAWLLLRDASTRQGAAWSLLLLGIANWETISSGTVKEAYMLVLFLNLAGSALIAVSPRRPTERLRLIAGAACAGVVLVLVSAPLWLVFLDTLAKSTTHYDHRITRQARFSELIGFFEDLFARQLRPNESHAYPSANIVILLGCCWAIVGGWRARIREPWVLIMAAAIPLALAFGVIPGDLLHNIPLVSRIEHFDNTFGCVLLVLLTLLSGFGMKFMFTERAARQWLQPAAMAMGGCLVLVGLFYASNRECSVSRFFIFYALSLVFGILALHLALRGSACILHRGLGTAGLLAALSVLLWRHSQYLHTPFDAYVFNPKVRANLTASSPAVERVRQLSTEPNRATGLGYNLFSGYSMAIRLETIYGVEPLRNAYFDELTIGGGINKMNWGDPASWNENDARVLLPLLELLNVRFYLSTPNPPPNQVDNLRLLGRYDLDVFDSPGTWPRAYVTNNIGTYATVRDLLKLLKQPNRPKPFAFVQDSDPESLRIPAMSPAPKRYAARATGYILTSNSTSFTIEAPGPGVAVLTETYNPDFQVTLNGAPASLLRVNHAFRGVWVPRAGVYRVRFAYWPSIVTRALWIAAIGASLGVLGFWLIHSGRIQVIGETLSSECHPS
ncbi:hypothetical protein DB347_14755 [Opitutaceae bacterium EW11]|nr:hypothetical protein DB347_14755 [Opitutaceae bacterium EW11]